MVYDVHSIEAKRRKGGKTEYFIQWKDHLPSENTWEPMSNLQGSEELVNEFEKAWQAKYDAAEAEASQDRERRRHTPPQAPQGTRPGQAQDTPLHQAQDLNRVDVNAAVEGRAASASALGIHTTLLFLPADHGFAPSGRGQRGTGSLRNNRSCVYKAYSQVNCDGHMCWSCECPSKNNNELKCGIVPSSTNNTTNMWSHLRNHHPEVFTSLHRHAVMPNEITSVEPSPSRPAMAVRPKFSLQTKGQADCLTTEWILASHSALNAGQHKRYKALISFLTGSAYAAPTYYTVKKHTTMYACDGRQMSSDFVAKLLADGIKPAGALDPWSDNGIGLLGVQLHGIDRQPPSISISTPEPPLSIWELQTHLAGASPFGGSHHTAAVIKAQYDGDLRKLKVFNPVQDLFANVIDGASNMQAALADRFALWCNVHKLQRSVELFRSYADIVPILAKCRGTVGHFNHSTIGKNELKTYQAEAGLSPHNLTQDVVIRWSSMHDMLDDLRVNREPLMVYDIRAKNPGAVYGANKLCHDDWAVVNGMITVLQPAADGTRLLEGDQYVTSSLVVPTIRKVLFYADPSHSLPIPWSTTHQSISHEQLPVEVQGARQAYYDDLCERWLEEMDTDHYYFWFNCSILDPRFKSLDNILGLTDSDKTDARASFDSLYRMHWAPAVDMELSVSDSEPIDVDAAPPTRNETAVCGRRSHVNLVSFLSPQSGERIQPESNAKKNELEVYFALPDADLSTDPLLWWPRHEKLLPSLSRMARQFLGVPASSAAVERLFSGVGKDFAKQRQAMNEETLEEVTWARSYIKKKYEHENEFESH